MKRPIHLEEYFADNSKIGLLILRLFVGLRLIYGVIDNVISWEKMIEFSHFLELHNFPLPMVCAIVSVYVQLLGAIGIVLGYKLRIAAFFLGINFIVALVFFHIQINDSIEGMTPALAMFSGSIALLFTGAGELSLDYWVASKRNVLEQQH